MKQHARHALFGLVLLLLVFCLLALFAAAQTPAPQPTTVEIKIDLAKFDAYVGQYEDATNLGGQVYSFFRRR